MPSEFKTIDTYLSQCQLLSRVKDDCAEFKQDKLSDQKVPQCLLNTELEDIHMLEDHDISGFYSRLHNSVFENTKNAGPVENSNCFPVDMSMGTSDDYVNRDSTHHILDLDRSRTELNVVPTEQLLDVRIKKEVDSDATSYSCASECTQWSNCDPYSAQISIPSDPHYYADFYDTCSSEMESVQTLLINQVKRDICSISSQLGISQDPHNWSEDDVHLWVYYMLQQQKLSVREANNFTMINGRKLCLMTESDMRFAAPCGGCQLFVQIEIWKNAIKIEDNQYTYAIPKLEPDLLFPASYSHYTHETPMMLHRNQVMASVSPAPSAGSIDSHVSNASSSPASEVNMTAADCQVDPSEPPSRKQTIHLWQFLKQLLLSEKYPRAIRWLDRSQGIFKIENSSVVARLWGRRKNRPAMNYDKLSRSIRQYYKKGIIRKTLQSKRLVYQFCRPYVC